MIDYSTLDAHEYMPNDRRGPITFRDYPTGIQHHMDSRLHADIEHRVVRRDATDIEAGILTHLGYLDPDRPRPVARIRWTGGLRQLTFHDAKTLEPIGRTHD
ncbi:hypothetical protein [Gordonia sp. KTR9]|uniref:hypothetical protein n=1 Tax=Gordonia sp. KTR9 TaxID=337191 RepID=UPI0003027949|nr:hypothetical protein [Gordonia sp. KTR9]